MADYDGGSTRYPSTPRRSQCRGQGFDPPLLHHPKPWESWGFAFLRKFAISRFLHEQDRNLHQAAPGKRAPGVHGVLVSFTQGDRTMATKRQARKVKKVMSEF